MIVNSKFFRLIWVKPDVLWYDIAPPKRIKNKKKEEHCLQEKK
jgi:hypothetical protein